MISRERFGVATTAALIGGLVGYTIALVIYGIISEDVDVGEVEEDDFEKEDVGVPVKKGGRPLSTEDERALSELMDKYTVTAAQVAMIRSGLVDVSSLRDSLDRRATDHPIGEPKNTVKPPKVNYSKTPDPRPLSEGEILAEEYEAEIEPPPDARWTVCDISERPRRSSKRTTPLAFDPDSGLWFLLANNRLTTLPDANVEFDEDTVDQIDVLLSTTGVRVVCVWDNDNDYMYTVSPATDWGFGDDDDNGSQVEEEDDD